MKLRKFIKIENKEYAITVRSRDDSELTREAYRNEVKFIITLMCVTKPTCQLMVEHLILIDDSMAVNKAISDCMAYARDRVKHSCFEFGKSPLTPVEFSVKEMLLKLGFD